MFWLSWKGQNNRSLEVLIQEEEGGVIYMILSLEHILVFNGDKTKEGSTLDSSTSL